MSQLTSRIAGENSARLTLVRLLCAVSVWRTAMTRVLPLCGGAAWWVTLLCLLPGFSVALLLRWMLRLTCSATLAEGVRACLGRTGAVLLSCVMTMLLLSEGVSSMTALITLFTEGLGARGTQLTLAALTGVALLLSLHREGLPRAAHLLRWGMIAAAVTLGAWMLSKAQLDHLFPLQGEGERTSLEALKAGMSLAWPVALLLSAAPSRQGRLCRAILPVFSAAGTVLLLTLTIPHELLIRRGPLASLLLMPVRYAPNALRVLAICLTMLAFFLAIGASASIATDYLCLLLNRPPVWLTYALLAGMVLSQAGDTPALWAVLGCIEPWLLLPLGGFALLCLPIAFIRRKRPCDT